MDESGVPIYTYLREIKEIKEKELIAGFMTALLQFGEEVFARPQRIDLNGYAISFYSTSVRGKRLWIAVISDSIDNPNATARVIKKLMSTISEEIAKAMGPSIGISIMTKELKETLDKKVEQIISRNLRLLASFRSGGVHSILFAMVGGAVTYLILSTLIFSIIIPLFVQHEVFFGLETRTVAGLLIALLIVLMYLVIGMVSVSYTHLTLPTTERV